MTLASFISVPEREIRPQYREATASLPQSPVSAWRGRGQRLPGGRCPRDRTRVVTTRAMTADVTCDPSGSIRQVAHPEAGGSLDRRFQQHLAGGTFRAPATPRRCHHNPPTGGLLRPRPGPALSAGRRGRFIRSAMARRDDRLGRHRYLRRPECRRVTFQDYAERRRSMQVHRPSSRVWSERTAPKCARANALPS